MAQPRKAATPPAAPAAKTPAKAPPASPASGANALRTTLTVFALFLLVGVIPSALAGETFGLWRLPSIAGQLTTPPWSLSYDASLPRPAPMLANATVQVVMTPGGSQHVATLQPGFAVQVTRYATNAGARWAQITWGGPTHTAGGSGWTLASGLIAASGASQSGQARDIGDLGALSPAFGQAIAALRPGVSAALYFPSAGASYASASIDQPVSLGSQIIPVLLTALYSKGIIAAQPNASSGPPTIAKDLVAGNAQALTFDYELVGDSAGLGAFMTQHQLAGFQFVAHQPAQATATARALSLFYTALATGALTNPHDQGEILALLASANATGASAVTQPTLIGSGALVVTDAHASATTSGVVSIAAGILQPANAPAVVVVAIAQGANSVPVQQAIQTFFQKLGPIAQG